MFRYLQVADDKKVKAIFVISEDEINKVENEWDESFVEELDKRRKSFVDGGAKRFSWEGTKQAVLADNKPKK